MIKNTRVAVLGLVLLLLAAGAVGYWWYYTYWQAYHGYDPKPFTPEAWAAAGAEARGYMVEDLLAKHPLKGMMRQEVVALLGVPDHRHTDEAAGRLSGIEYDVGFLGFNAKAPMVLPYRLVIKLGEDDRVREAFTMD